ncbi:MAG: dTDP-4-dehydrorhamnose reductase [Bacteroidales bacterium]|nr:dTDP-4-dehydrorhamnose reductase [Bacteroidales bacterium]
MNILVTGANGQLGMELQELAKKNSNWNFLFTDIHNLDITNRQALIDFTNENDFDFLINCAAYTAVDKAEEEPDKARLLNITAVEFLAEICNLKNATFIHISTDYVFGGQGYKPYIETDITAPKSVYAITKLGAEEAVKNSSKSGIIVRTSWLYSTYGHNFLKTMLRLGKERDALKVVFDQIGTPTYATDLAEAILNIVVTGKQSNNPVEIYHYSNEGVCSWYDFALAIMEESGLNCKVMPITTAEYPLPAERPFYSVLDKSLIKKHFDLKIPHWRESMKLCLQKLNER